MDLSIIVVTYNSAHLIDGLLSHVKKEIDGGLKAEVIVVDNASRDKTTSVIRTNYRWVKLIESKINLGFAAGNNLAAQSAKGAYILLLNPDAIPDFGSLTKGLELMKKNPQVGLGGGQLYGVDGLAQPSARMFPRLRDEFFTISGLANKFPNSKQFSRLDRRWANPDEPAEVDWIPGAFIFIPTHLFNLIGGFDERFFMYYEEVDLCRRLQESGFKIQYWPSLRAMHIGGESAKTVEKGRVSLSGSQLESWRMRSALLYYRKQHGLFWVFAFLSIEWTWYKLRQIKAICSRESDKASDFSIHCAQLVQAWKDSHGGNLSPAKPW
jgi:N-acetylglucosaminyl-diphospho-decaprenol L-rhamnosyltransferase